MSDKRKRIGWGVVTLLFLTGLGAALAQDAVGSFAIVRGKVEFVHKGEEIWTEATVGAQVVNGDTVRTGRGGRAELSFIDGSLVRIASLTTMQIRDIRMDPVAKSKRSFIYLFSGKMRAKVGKLPAGSRFEISTPVAVAAVHGTDFTIYHIRRVTTVIVLDGTVEVRNISEEVGGSILLKADQISRVLQGRPPVSARRLPSRERIRIRKEMEVKPEVEKEEVAEKEELAAVAAPEVEEEVEEVEEFEEELEELEDLEEELEEPSDEPVPESADPEVKPPEVEVDLPPLPPGVN